MAEKRYYENYPSWMVFVSNLFSMAIYALGALILYRVGVIWMILYLLFIGILEFRLMRGHCVDCYYYGKTCAFGKGRLSALFFRGGDVRKFCKMRLEWKDMIPDLLVSLIPIVAAIVLLIMRFDLMLLAFVVLLFLLVFVGNGIVCGQLACKYCKQRMLGCPAEKLFNKGKKDAKKM